MSPCRRLSSTTRSTAAGSRLRIRCVPTARPSVGMTPNAVSVGSRIMVRSTACAPVACGRLVVRPKKSAADRPASRSDFTLTPEPRSVIATPGRFSSFPRGPYASFAASPAARAKRLTPLGTRKTRPRHRSYRNYRIEKRRPLRCSNEKGEHRPPGSHAPPASACQAAARPFGTRFPPRR